MAIFRIPINITWPGGGSPGVNVFHCRDDAWPGSTNLDSALTALSAAYTAWTNATTGAAGQGVSYSLGEIIELESQSYVQPGAGVFPTQTVAGSSGMGPAPVMVVVSWKTSLAARRGMGRTFLGPVSGLVLENDGTPAIRAVNAANAFAQRIIDHNGTVGTANFGIYGADQPLTDAQKASGDYPRVLRDITAFKVRDKWAVLTSRRD